jgi:DNA-binding CsgD family transcriptional regulator
MSFWQRLSTRLLRAFGYDPSPRLSFELDQTMIESLQDLAVHDRRQTDEVAADLLSYALARRYAADVNLQSWRELSPREQQVAALVCLNFTNRQIANRLSISPETVKSHVRSVLHKFGLRSKLELRQALADWDFSAWQG